ncbi:endonuclease/exonuclease/phosphatase family protein [Veronia pacifica]|uniref:endonuclease/exonuclease/phosphatase family protein n=1 Tax=Veronia pacifica TaxID=1080227 RepID=UPI003643CCBB
MKGKKHLLSLLISTTLLAGCAQTTVTKNKNVQPAFTVAAYNLSFDRGTFSQLTDELATSPSQQHQLVFAFQQGMLSGDNKQRAEKIIQIRNVAAAIQATRPHVLMMSEFNNDGTGDDTQALRNFQKNYLSVGQFSDGLLGGERLAPLAYPFGESFSTNTGLNSGYDLDNNGKVALPGDAWGFGFYHGQYAFAVLSQFEIDRENIRTFQQFKWKDLLGAQIPTITNCDSERYSIPDGMKCGDNWYSDEEWQQMRLSSKNHVDVPVIISTNEGDKAVHLLMSHPTPPVFDTVTINNKLRNRDEIKFWHDYIDGKPYFYDDSGKNGGLSEGANFVIMGDLNADPDAGDGFTETIGALLSHPSVNQQATTGQFVPTSSGGSQCYEGKECRTDNPYPARVTSTFGLRVDHVIPSNTLTITNSGVFWPALGELGRGLMNDKTVGKYGAGKDVSSDHRMVWIKASLN